MFRSFSNISKARDFLGLILPVAFSNLPQLHSRCWADQSSIKKEPVSLMYRKKNTGLNTDNETFACDGWMVCISRRRQSLTVSSHSKASGLLSAWRFKPVVS